VAHDTGHDKRTNRKRLSTRRTRLPSTTPRAAESEPRAGRQHHAAAARYGRRQTVVRARVAPCVRAVARRARRASVRRVVQAVPAAMALKFSLRPSVWGVGRRGAMAVACGVVESGRVRTVDAAYPCPCSRYCTTTGIVTKHGGSRHTPRQKHGTHSTAHVVGGPVELEDVGSQAAAGAPSLCPPHTSVLRPVRPLTDEPESGQWRPAIANTAVASRPWSPCGLADHREQDPLRRASA